MAPRQTARFCILVLLRRRDHGRAAEQLFDGPLQPTAADQCVETGVVRAEVFDALDYPRIRIEEARLAIDHLRARNLGQCFRLVRKAVDLGQFSRRKEARRGHPAVSRIAREMCFSTVLTEIPSRSATSLYEHSWKMRKVNAARHCGRR